MIAKKWGVAMANRVDIPFSNEHFMAFCRRFVGQPFWYGACCQKATAALLAQKAAQYPAQYTPDRMARCRRDIANGAVVADCIGAAKGYAWSGGGSGIFQSIGTAAEIALRPNTNGCPDKGADAMFLYAQKIGMAAGRIDTLPEIVGIALRKPGHTAYYLGHGEVIEWRGFDLGCTRSAILNRGFTHWYKLPFIRYQP